MSFHRAFVIGALCTVTVPAAPAAAQVFEVIHPDVEKNSFELEVLNGISLAGVEAGDERSAHEIAIGYAPTSFWMPKLAIELANPEGETAEFEAFEFENVFLLPFGDGAGGHAHDHAHEDGSLHYVLGFYGKLEVPIAGGLDEGAVQFGPIGEIALGRFNVLGNFLVDIPFENGTDPGLAYALAASTPVAPAIALGIEAHGAVEEAFGDAPALRDQEHLIGPAAYFSVDVGRGRVLEPRVALLAGLTDASPDAVLSFNVELKF